MPFPFETLDVYRIALEWVASATRISMTVKSSELAPLADQLVRAATSIPLNIAEGNGRWHKGDKKQYFWIARGSVFECAAILQVVAAQELISSEAHKSGYETLTSLGKMLTKLVQSVDSLRNSSSLAKGSTELDAAQ